MIQHSKHCVTPHPMPFRATPHSAKDMCVFVCLLRCRTFLWLQSAIVKMYYVWISYFHLCFSLLKLMFDSFIYVFVTATIINWWLFKTSKLVLHVLICGAVLYCSFDECSAGTWLISLMAFTVGVDGSPVMSWPSVFASGSHWPLEHIKKQSYLTLGKFIGELKRWIIFTRLD